MSQPPSRGASARKRGARTAVSGWWQHHLDSWYDSCLRVAQRPWQSLATSLVLGISLALPTLFYLLFANLQQLGERLNLTPTLTAYTAPGVRDSAVEALVEELTKRPSIASVTYRDPTAALAQFEADTGLTDVLSSLPSNPLPGTLIVQPADHTPAAAERLQRELMASGVFDAVELDHVWLARLEALSGLAERLGLALALLLGVGALLVVGNTVGLAIENRRDEILIIKMVGATAQYVQRPFLYSGAITGALGGLLAGLLTAIIQLWLAPRVRHLLDAYDSQYTVMTMGPSQLAMLIVVGAALGWLGAQVAVSRHLWQIEPK